MSRNIATFVLAATLTAVGARAQSSTFEHDVTWSWPVSLGSAGTLKRTACGDVTGDARPDLFVRGNEGGQGITFFSAPGGTASSMVLSPTCNDFDIAPKAGIGGLDALVFVGVSGLARLDFSIESQVFESSVTISDSSAWLGAVLVRSADVNSSGVADYVGLKANRTTISYRRDTSPGTFTESTFSASGVVKDMQLVRWIVGRPLAVVLRLGNGFEVRDLAEGTSLGAFTFEGAVADAIAVVPTGGTLVDRVALLTRTNGGSERLRTFRRALPTPESDVEFDNVSGLIASSIAVGDMNGDSDNDLIVSWTTTNELRVLANSAGVGAPPAFALSQQETVTWTAVSSGLSVFPNEAQVVFRDTNADGQADILFPIRNLVDSAIQGRLVRLERTANYLTNCGAFPDQSPNLDGQQEFQANVSLGKPLAVGGMTFPPGAERYLEVLVWQQIPALIPSTATPSNPAAMRKFHYPIVPLFPGGLPLAPEQYPNIRVFDIDIGVGGEPGCGVPDVRFVEFREVIAEGTRTYHAGPTFTLAVTSHDGMNNLMGGEPNACHRQVLTTCSGGSGGVRSHVRVRRAGPPPGEIVTVPTPTPMVDLLEIVNY
ncbi:MAG: hypothetical protein SGI72_00105 [Planctomycetota bacterium]|nr:hypothetical protein [Planctomycetota bacterium]